ICRADSAPPCIDENPGAALGTPNLARVPDLDDALSRRLRGVNAETIHLAHAVAHGADRWRHHGEAPRETSRCAGPPGPATPACLPHGPEAPSARPECPHSGPDLQLLHRRPLLPGA